MLERNELLRYPIESTQSKPESELLGQLNQVANFVRRDAFQTIFDASNGHLGASSSSTELMTALYFGGRFNFDPNDPDNPNRDLVLVRGHAGPLRYPIFSLLGYIERDELTGYRELGTRLPGHEDMHITPGVDITPSGSLGMLLSYGVGAATEIQNDGRDNRVVVFLGDGEEQEGNVSEAARHAASLKLDNLVCILDQNSKQLSRSTSHSDGASNIGDIWRGYGWDVLEIEDGHNMQEILNTYDQLQIMTKPTLVIANTIKGYRLPGNDDSFNGYHTLSTFNRESLGNVIEGLSRELDESGGEASVPVIAAGLVARPRQAEPAKKYTSDAYRVEIPEEIKDANIEDAQTAYFRQLTNQLEQAPDSAPFYALTPDYITSPIATQLGFEGLQRFYDTGLREQHTIAMAHGISVTNPDARIFVYTGDAFLFRAMDQINAAAQGLGNIVLMGGDSGLSNDRNGKTHQSVAQAGALMHIPEVRAFEPADSRDLFNVLNLTLGQNAGFSYIRLHGETVLQLERNEADLENTDAYLVHEPDAAAKFIIFASGFPVGNAVEAAKQLEVTHGLSTRVVNVVNHKTLDKTIHNFTEGNAPVLTVYNGNPTILHNQVSSAIMSRYDSSRKPRIIGGHGFTGGSSGRFKDLEAYYQLDAAGIINKALEVVNKVNIGML